MRSNTLFAALSVVGSTIAIPQLVPRYEGTCNADNLLRCFINTKSTSQASAYCATLAPTTITVATITASTTTSTTATIVANTETNVVTSLILSTITNSVPISTVTVNVDGAALAKRSTSSSLPNPSCLTANYGDARITSACSCIGVPAVTVYVTHTASIQTLTSITTSDITTTTATTTLTTSSTSTEVDYVATSTCGAPNPSNVITNGDFECDTLAPWYIAQGSTSEARDGSTGVHLIAGNGSNYRLKTICDYYLNTYSTITQNLNTIAGQTYTVSFVLQIDGGGGNNWDVSVGSTSIASGSTGFGDDTTFSGTFVAAGNDQLNIQVYPSTWAYGYFYWDNFVITAVV